MAILHFKSSIFSFIMLSPCGSGGLPVSYGMDLNLKLLPFHSKIRLHIINFLMRSNEIVLGSLVFFVMGSL